MMEYDLINTIVVIATFVALAVAWCFDFVIDPRKNKQIDKANKGVTR